MTGWPSALTSGLATKAAAVGQNLDAKLTKAADKLDKSADRLADKAAAGVQMMSKNLSSRAASWKSSWGKKIFEAAGEAAQKAGTALAMFVDELQYVGEDELAALITALHDQGFEIAIETNGTLEVPKGIDWICVSPKAGAPWVQREGHELKLVYPQPALMPDDLGTSCFEHYLLQAMDGPDRLANTRAAIAYCQSHPSWRLSVQTHKVLEIR